MMKTLNESIVEIGELIDGHFAFTADEEKEEMANRLYKAIADCRDWNDGFDTVTEGLNGLYTKEELDDLLPRASVRTELTNQVKPINVAITKLKKIGVTDEMLSSLDNYKRLSQTEERNAILQKLVFANSTLSNLPKDENTAWDLITDKQIETLRKNLKASEEKIQTLKDQNINNKDIYNMLDYYRIAIAKERLADEDEMLGALEIYDLARKLPDKATLDDKEKIAAIKSKYESLSDEEKSYVAEEILVKIEKLQEQINELEKDKKIKVVFDTNNGSDRVEKEVQKDEVLEYTPESPSKEGYVFVGWFKDVDNITTEYKSGQTYDTDVTYKAKYAHVKMLGAQAKAVVDDKSGIRFGTKIYDDGDKIVEKVTLIIPANLLSEGEALTLDNKKAARSMGKVNYEVNKEENSITYLGTLAYIPKAQFDRELTSVAYVIYKDKAGNEYKVYSPYSNGTISVNKLLNK